jgi:hypothetical protein
MNQKDNIVNIPSSFYLKYFSQLANYGNSNVFGKQNSPACV